MVIMLGVGRCSGRRSGSPRLSFFFCCKIVQAKKCGRWVDGPELSFSFFPHVWFLQYAHKKKSGQAQAWKSGLAGRRYVVFLWGEKIGGIREAEEEQWGEE